MPIIENVRANCTIIKSSEMPETLEEKNLYNDEDYNCQVISCNIEGNNFCTCSFKEKSHKFTLEDLEEKRWQLINLQKAILNLRQVYLKKRKSESKLMKLAIKSKCRFIYPDIKMSMETSKRVAYENELVKSELCYLNNANMKEANIDIYQEKKNNVVHLLQNSKEIIYKIFEGRVGHLHGDNLCAYVIISSEALYIVSEDFGTKLNEVLYENVELIIVGKDDRWFSVVGKESDVVNSSEKDAWYFQIDTGDATVTRDIIKYLEISVRRRLIALSVTRNKSEGQVRNLNDTFKSDSTFVLQNSVAFKRIRFSYGRWLESLLPSVLSCSDQEVYYIENWLMEELKIKKRPQVLACWLVFWENGSEFWCEEAPIDPSPCLDGYLMVNSSQHNVWTPAYFLLKGGMLYRFCDSCDKLPQSVYSIRDYCGCQRLMSNARPHAFELMKSDGKSLIFAAPNGETASQWLQLFLRIISSEDDEYREKMKLKPCQVIQTTESLILTYQRNTVTLFRAKSSPENNNNNENLNLSQRNSVVPPLQDLKTKVNIKRMASKGTLIPTSLKITSTPLSSSMPIYIKESSISYNAECPPTPPLPEIGTKNKEAKSETYGDVDTNKPSLQLLSFCNLDQISEIFVTSWPTNGCLMEFECSEASEIVGDWVLYFSSETQLSAFLKSILEYREKLTEELIGLTKVSSGRVNDLLLEGAETSKSYWKPCKGRLN